MKFFLKKPSLFEGFFLENVYYLKAQSLHYLKTLSKKISAGLSKLHSTCPGNTSSK